MNSTCLFNTTTFHSFGCGKGEQCVLSEGSQGTLSHCQCAYGFHRDADSHCILTEDPRTSTLLEIRDVYLIVVLLTFLALCLAAVIVFAICSKKNGWYTSMRNRGAIDLMEESFVPDNEEPASVTIFE